MGKYFTPTERVLREKLVQIIAVICEATKHIDNDWIVAESRKFSISLTSEQILEFRKIKRLLDGGRI